MQSIRMHSSSPCLWVRPARFCSVPMMPRRRRQSYFWKMGTWPQWKVGSRSTTHTQYWPTGRTEFESTLPGDGYWFTTVGAQSAAMAAQPANRFVCRARQQETKRRRQPRKRLPCQQPQLCKAERCKWRRLLLRQRSFRGPPLLRRRSTPSAETADVLHQYSDRRAQELQGFRVTELNETGPRNLKPSCCGCQRTCQLQDKAAFRSFPRSWTRRAV